MDAYRAPENLLLRAAARARRPELLRRVKIVHFDAGHRFWTAGERIPCAVFPLRGLVSLQIAASAEKRVEVALTGREGFAGVSLLLGEDRARMTAAAMTTGEAAVMSREAFRTYLRHAVFRDAAEKYVQLFLFLVAQTSICNRVHVIEKLCIGRLLQMQDRTGAESFHVTQDYFSRLLGVRRASVSRVAARLQQHGAIRYDGKGRLTILDRGRLEKLACHCYHTMKSEFDDFVQTGGGL